MVIDSKVIQKLHDILKDEAAGLVGKWRAGELVDKLFRSLPAKTGELAALSDALPAGVSASTQTLHNYRTLARKWELHEVQSAQRNGLPWNRMVQLLSIKPMLANIPKSKKKKFKNQLSELMADTSPAKEWTRKCKAFKQQIGAKGRAIPPKKKISEQGRVAASRLRDAVEALEGMRDAIPKALRAHHEAILSELKRLKAEIERMNADMLSPEKLAPYEDF